MVKAGMDIVRRFAMPCCRHKNPVAVDFPFVQNHSNKAANPWLPASIHHAQGTLWAAIAAETTAEAFFRVD